MYHYYVCDQGALIIYSIYIYSIYGLSLCVVIIRKSQRSHHRMDVYWTLIHACDSMWFFFGVAFVLLFRNSENEREERKEKRQQQQQSTISCVCRLRIRVAYGKNIYIGMVLLVTININIYLYTIIIYALIYSILCT